MLELDDIQHFLLARPRALAARYGFLTFPQPAGARAWLSGIIDKVGTGRAVGSGGSTDTRWVTVAFTWSGRRALRVPAAALATIPEEFRQGMAARAEILGDTGANHPDYWVGGLASSDLHAIVILFASDVAERERCVREHQQYAARFPDVTALSTLDLEAIPPLGYAHEHFGYRDRLTTPAIEGIGDVATPGSGPPLKAGEFFLGYPDESGVTPRAHASNFFQLCRSGEDFGQITGVHCGCLALARHTFLPRILLQQTEGKLAEQRQVGRPVPVLHLVGVLMKSHIQLPVQVVLDPPVTAQRRQITPRRHPPAADKVTHVLGRLPAHRALAAAHPDHPQMRPRRPIADALHILDDHTTPPLLAPVPALDRRVLPHAPGRQFAVQGAFHRRLDVRPEPLLVGLGHQDVVAAPIDDLLGDVL